MYDRNNLAADRRPRQRKILLADREVTLMCGRQQVNNELLPISRHLADAKKEKENTVSIFVAPRIHDDVRRYISFIKFDEGLNIKAYGINEFLDVVNNYSTMDELIAHE